MKNKILIKIDAEIAELIPNYITSLQNTYQNLIHALKENDLETCNRLGHNLKGSGASYGFNFISEIGSYIEIASKNKQINIIESNLSELIKYLNNLEVKVA